MARENDSGKIPAEQGHENRDPAEATRIGHRRPRDWRQDSGSWFPLFCAIFFSMYSRCFSFKVIIPIIRAQFFRLVNVVRHYLAAQHWEAGVEELLACLNPWLMANWQTAIVAAVDEPFYQPADSDHPIAEIQFAHGYFNSVLHELAHWCVAGAERRKLPDFGYWYEPDGRTAEQQALFEKDGTFKKANARLQRQTGI